MLIAFIVRRKK